MIFCRKPPWKTWKAALTLLYSILHGNMSNTLNDLSKLFLEQMNVLKKSYNYVLTRRQKAAIPIPDFFMPGLIMRYCTCVHISSAISEPKIFSFSFEETAVRHFSILSVSKISKFTSYEKNHFFKCFFVFVLFSRLKSFVKS